MRRHGYMGYMTTWLAKTLVRVEYIGYLECGPLSQVVRLSREEGPELRDFETRLRRRACEANKER